MIIKRLKSILVVAIAAVVFASGTSISPYAQQQPKAPATHVQILIPETPLPGWDPTTWSRLRQSCQSVADKSAAHLPLTRGEFAASEECESVILNLYPPPPAANSYPAPAPAVAPIF